MSETIDISAYDPSWPDAFDAEAKRLLAAFGNEAAAIEHVGSTAIPRQRAKPVIDIFVGVSPFRGADYYEGLLDAVHYRFVRTGMRNRWLFGKFADGVWTHNIHIVPYDGGFYHRNELLLRDYLRKRPDLVDAYGELKLCSAEAHGGDLESYTRSKTEFIQSVIDAARKEKGLPLEDVWTNEPL